MRFQLLAARLALTALILATLAAAAAIAAVRTGALAYPSGLAAMTGATALGLIALICALAWLFNALKHNTGAGKRIGLLALAGSLLLLYPPLSNVWHGLTAPAIHDASSDPDDPPVFVALAKLRKPGMNPPAYDGGRIISFRGETNTVNYMLHTYYYPDPVGPHAFLLMTKPRLFWHAFELVKSLGWRIVDYSPADGRIEATQRSFWFGQTADIVIRVRASGTLGARIDVRSQSETGRTDFGANLARLKQFFQAQRENRP